MSKRRKGKKPGPADPRTPEGMVQRRELKEQAAKKMNKLFTATREPEIPVNAGEDLKPYEGEEI